MKASGNFNVIELPAITRWTRNGGKTLVRRFTGPSSLIGVAGDISPTTKAGQLKNAGVDHEIEREPGKLPILSATYGGDESQDPNTPLSDQWLLDINELEKDIWEIPAIAAAFEKCMKTAHPPSALTIDDTAFEVAKLKRDLRTIISGDAPERDGTILSLPQIYANAATLGIDTALLKLFVQELVKGVQAFEIDQYVIRRVRVVTESTAIQAIPAEGNIRKMISSASMISLEKAPAQFPVIGKIPDGFWLKKRPKAEPASPGKWTIHQEYWHADTFSKFIYGDAI